MEQVVCFNLADLVDPNDPDGRSYRQVNAARPHAIPIGTLIELDSGVRLFIVMHGRDCDQTPLYTLSADPNDTVEHRPGFANASQYHGYPEESLTPVQTGRGSSE